MNVAESLSRLPGVTIDRTAGGEGAKVSINGIDSRLILTQFNGQPIATTEAGANNRDTGRSFNFRNLAPELIGTVEVYKTSEARLDEGGVGGSIIVNSRLPFELPRNTLSVAANYNVNLRNKERTPRASILYSWYNEDKTFGIWRAWPITSRCWAPGPSRRAMARSATAMVGAVAATGRADRSTTRRCSPW